MRFMRVNVLIGVGNFSAHCQYYHKIWLTVDTFIYSGPVRGDGLQHEQGGHHGGHAHARVRAAGEQRGLRPQARPQQPGQRGVARRPH